MSRAKGGLWASENRPGTPASLVQHPPPQQEPLGPFCDTCLCFYLLPQLPMPCTLSRSFSPFSFPQGQLQNHYLEGWPPQPTGKPPLSLGQEAAIVAFKNNLFFLASTLPKALFFPLNFVSPQSFKFTFNMFIICLTVKEYVIACILCVCFKYIFIKTLELQTLLI